MPTIRSFETLCETPVPSREHLAELRKGWRTHELMSLVDGVDDLIDVRALGINGANHYYQERMAPYHMRIPGSIPMLLVRREVATRLSVANTYLRNVGLELFVFDAWRPQAVQHFCRNVWFPAHMRNLHPEWQPERINEEVERFWAHAVKTEEEIDTSGPPPHATGAAVDLTLQTTTGQHLSMGSGFDDFTDVSRIDAFEHPSGRGGRIVRENRRILSGVMHDLGFVGHPNEWWHYSFGDQAWAIAHARMTGKHVPAHFGAVNPLPYLPE
ncbi:hypothetical protein A3C89_01005 [Candidatus Kaiserbacteria bacterium RIFCSPHIGHO2_02_FULL_50_50]|uniref:D-alanyl-D-alanine dipeptidase n=1 Tax=Candidatus Kaiserbacteria bacterium RIFCSPHIGHO2_02_FULL_50_50 TaxID=1798492 RepID=A0A1F6DDQ8_9BACT|nr:MAG: hypothetical protein A3C89_01005 [Candidatus Kaiserbacteria bacterium RIFCSPHIGHO2_02_FULL_50_50]OGG89286.1 MAG: hypothetical protein A3G62_01405 [Candidatus Kaiserbacteria bacterium RIFCSPLOWO2_12_FULL_50_10]